MVTELTTQPKSLYETDYHLWVLETVKQLESRDLAALDWENLIEEVSDLSRRDRKKLRSLLKRLLEHLLKLQYWQSELPYNQNHWKGEVRNFRQLIKYELEDSPSLKSYLEEVFIPTYQDALRVVSDKSGLVIHDFPKLPIATLEQVLDEEWFPEVVS